MSGEQIVQRPIGLCRDVTRELDLRSFGRTDRSKDFQWRGGDENPTVTNTQRMSCPYLDRT
jgi:hypothetical protein